MFYRQMSGIESTNCTQMAISLLPIDNKGVARQKKGGKECWLDENQNASIMVVI